MLYALLLQAVVTTTIAPSANCWVYSRASAPSDDQYLRAWGQAGVAIGDVSSGEFNFSWSLLGFDSDAFPDSGKITAAHLRLTHIPDPVWTEGDSAQAPLEVRIVDGKLDESKWRFADAASLAPAPTDDVILGSASPAPPSGKQFVIDIDLLKGPGKLIEALKVRIAKHQPLTLALTSRMEPQGGAGGKFYKVYSRYAKKSLQPALIITSESKQ